MRRSVISIGLLIGALVLAPPASGVATLVTQWGGTGTGNGQFSSAEDVAIGAGGQVYVADPGSGNGRISRFTSDGAFLSTWGGAGTGASQFASPNGVATDTAGNVYVTDLGNARVQKFSADGTFQLMWGWNVDTGGSAGFEICTAQTLPCFIGTSGSGAGQFFNPVGVAVDGANNVYVSEFAGQQRVQKFTSTGAPTGVSWGSVGTADGQFNRPIGLAVDGFGDVYVADRDNARIQKFNSSGVFITKWGTPGSGNGQLQGPEKVAIAPDGFVGVADYTNFRVQRFNALGSFFSVFSTIAGGPTMFRPVSITFDPQGDLYIVNKQDNTILRVRDVPAAGPLTLADLPDPQLGVDVNIDQLAGKVLVGIPKRRAGAGRARASQKGVSFVPLSEARQIPVGSFLDTRKGKLRLQSARNSRGTRQQGDFASGLFQVLQSRKRSARGLTDLVLKGSSFSRCKTAGRGKRRARRSGVEARGSAGRTIRRLRGSANGRFRTRGRRSSATVRGTVWTVTDRCDGTLTKVKRGKVAVRDFRRKKTIVLRAGKSYLAR